VPILQRKAYVGILAAVVFLTIAALTSFLQPDPEPQELLRLSRLELARGNFIKAEQLAIVAADSDDSADQWAWMVAAEAAARANRIPSALEFYKKITSGSPDLVSAAAHGRAEMRLQLGKLQEAENDYLEALNADPGNLLTRRRLSDLYNLTGRRHRAIPLMESLIGTVSGTLEDLFYLGDVDHGVQVPDDWRSKKTEPDTDPLILLSIGYAAMAENHSQEAYECFKRAVSGLKGNADAVAGLGQVLAQMNSQDIILWSRELTPELLQDSSVLAAAGLWLERQQRYEDAVHAYAKAAALRPDSRVAWHRFGQSLSRTGRVKEASIVLEHAERLQQLALWLDDLFGHRQQIELVRRIVVQLSTLGRVEEATAWCHYALQAAPQTEWAVKYLTEFEGYSVNTARRRLNEELESLLESIVSKNWRPEFHPASEAANRLTIKKTRPEAQFEFADEAASSGLKFTHVSARDASTPGARIIETTGGGAGVIDVDADTWPDLYLPQGSSVFPVQPDNPDRDHLFRNKRGTQWVNVSGVAGIADPAFSQGLAVGDFNNDGFQDVYLANYGFNRLLQNLGDGTFEDVTPPALRLSPVWTTSCLIADLNSDGNPDLFDVTYCKGASVPTLICEQDGKPRSCSPRAFEAEDDRLWLSTGDGGWEQAAEASLTLADGPGLGIVAFRPATDQPLSLFIANDEAPNFWLRPREASSSENFDLEEVAAVSGLAVDADGKPQACMGVAADDINQDGLMEIFVTNFIQESNTLYKASTPDFFEDGTRLVGLQEPSWNMLGFGTQFLDANLDGWPDLFVANGHIDDLSESGQPFEMPAQFFLNTGGTFTEAANAAPLRSTVGRAAARIDWNRDGREDIIVANQHSPVQLLTNHTASAGRSLALQFRATSSSRDAIGTIVRIQSGHQTITRQLTAGDGYMASNERQIIVGLDPLQKIEMITIFWPGGVVQQLLSPELPQRVTIVEKRPPVSID